MLIASSLIELVRNGKVAKVRGLEISAKHKEDQDIIKRQKQQIKEERKEFDRDLDTLKGLVFDSEKKLNDKETIIERLLQENTKLRKLESFKANQIGTSPLIENKLPLSSSVKNRMTNSQARIFDEECRILSRALSSSKFELATENAKNRKISNLKSTGKLKDHQISKGKF